MNNQDIIRLAIPNDSERILEIRNHLKNRPFFNSSEVIKFSEHNNWFKKQYFEKKENHCFVLENQDLVIGYSRFDLNNNHELVVSIALDPDFISKGLGTYLLSESLKMLEVTYDIIAEIKKDNVISIRLFEKCNFKKYLEKDTNIYLKFKK